MSVTSCCSECFVLFYVFVLYGLLCHGALKLDLSTLFTIFFFEHLFKLYCSLKNLAGHNLSTSCDNAFVIKSILIISNFIYKSIKFVYMYCNLRCAKEIDFSCNIQLQKKMKHAIDICFVLSN